MAVRTAAENQRLCDALATHWSNWVPLRLAQQCRTAGRAATAQACRLRREKPPALMLQGTSSNAGKSILTAAFCRILFQTACAWRPFKAQNMSLNSFVTREGGEMGCARSSRPRPAGWNPTCG